MDASGGRGHGRANELLGQALRLYQQLGNTAGVAVVLNTLGRLAVAKNASDRAIQLCRDSLRLLQEIGDLHDIAECLEVMAAGEVQHHELVSAARLLGAASAMRQSIGAPLPPVERPMRDGTPLAASTALGEAQALMDYAKGQELTLAEVVACALESTPPPLTTYALATSSPLREPLQSPSLTSAKDLCRAPAQAESPSAQGLSQANPAHHRGREPSPQAEEDMQLPERSLRLSDRCQELPSPAADLIPPRARPRMASCRSPRSPYGRESCKQGIIAM